MRGGGFVLAGSLGSLGSRLAFGSVVCIAALALMSCTEPTRAPLRFPVLADQGRSDWTSVSTGENHTCALKVSGSAYCWGDNQFGETGVAVGDTLCGATALPYHCVLVPTLVSPTLTFLSISAGARHTCAISVTHDAYCWGANDSSQLGGVAAGGPAPIKIVGALPYAQISAGLTHTCAVRTDGQLFCWGSNSRGELGNNSFVGSATPVHVQVPGLVASVSAGDKRTCARTTVGDVYCWGSIWTARVQGIELSRAQLTPEKVPAAPEMSSLAVGTFTTCGATLTGVLYCWEANPRGEMGIGTLDGSTIPVTIAGDVNFVQLAAGIVQTCGIATSGIGYCWGDDSFGELGIPPSLVAQRCDNQQLPCVTTPQPVIGTQRFVDISTGFGSHSCGVTTQGNLYCWGLGSSGQRGDGTSGGAISTPLRVVEPGTSPP